MDKAAGEARQAQRPLGSREERGEGWAQEGLRGLWLMALCVAERRQRPRELKC